MSEPKQNHTEEILYLCLCPCGGKIVSGYTWELHQYSDDNCFMHDWTVGVLVCEKCKIIVHGEHTGEHGYVYITL